MTTSPTDEFELAAGERTSSDPVEIDMGYESTKFVVGATNTKNEYRLKSIRDPFAFREGKALIWTKVNMTLVRHLLASRFNNARKTDESTN
jgi:hypothetical protein